MPSNSVRQIVVADDDQDLLKALQYSIESWGYGVKLAASKQELLPLCQKLDLDLLILDIHFGDVNGIDLLEQLVRDGLKMPVIILTAHGSVDNAVRAVKQGAFDFLTKPPNLEHLRQVIDNALHSSINCPQNELVSPNSSKLLTPIIGDSDEIGEVLRLVEVVAPTDAKVMILGESGVGKELVARRLHEQSLRHDGPFVAVNMATLPETLAESMLFGHERGAFTGADEKSQGWCEQAHKGTLFLDEIGEMDINLQAKLLRFLQTGSLQRVGAKSLTQVDVRIICATNRDPLEMVQKGLMREDLYYRLAVLPITIPPLRERIEDIPALVESFVNRLCQKYSRKIESLSENAMEALQTYHWPGNVRELENMIERLVILCRDSTIELEHLPTELMQQINPGALATIPTGTNFNTNSKPEPVRTMDRIEKRAIMDALEKTQGNVVSAARILGVGQATVYRKIKRYRIDVPGRSPRKS